MSEPHSPVLRHVPSSAPAEKSHEADSTVTPLASPKLTSIGWKVITVLAGAPAEGLYSQQICEAAELNPSPVHSTLGKLVDAGWARSYLERPDQRAQTADLRGAGRPARRYFQLTDAGRAALAEHTATPTPAPEAHR